MIRRFQIDDLIFQDTSGVTFRALDTETGATVALRRFFPFGPDGGGLQPDEQTAYNIALERLAGISHPSLRSVIAGGCDPVDGIPYIATEWVQGDPLHQLMADGPLTAESAAKLVTQALEVCELLSHVLAEESVWIDTDITSIVVGSPRSGREFTFWISPLKWLGVSGEYRGLKSIVALTEEILGWRGRPVNDQAGRGLGIWLNWLRVSAETTTLKEARESLAAAIGVEPPPPVKAVVATATRPMVRTARPMKPVKKRKSKAPIFTALVLLWVIAGAAGWWWVSRKAKNLNAEIAKVSADLSPSAVIAENEPAPSSTDPTEAPVAAAPAEPAKPSEPKISERARLEEVNRRIAELSSKKTATTEKNTTVTQQSAKSLEAQKSELEKSGGIYAPSHRDLLLKLEEKPVELEGVLKSLDFSQTKLHMYLLFDGDADGDWSLARGSIDLRGASQDLKEDAIKSLVGKKVRIKGTVEIQSNSGRSRPLIEIKDRASITEAP